MEIHPLISISPIDGRYHGKTTELNNYFSEFALFKYRTLVEIEYFIQLHEAGLKSLNPLSAENAKALRDIYIKFSLNDAKRIKEIESVTNHDIKAVEYFIKERLDKLGLSENKEFVHFGLTSQDINNTSIPVSIKDALNDVLLPELKETLGILKGLAEDWKDIPMLAKTHGQPASPTKLGKELNVFVYRLQNQIDELSKIPISGKFGGATGNLNAHFVAYPNVDWVKFSNDFLKNQLGIQRQQVTTQIENYDYLASLFDAFKRIDTILLDLCRDIWTYVSMDYFKQKIKKGEVGSSAMPHKVNPIDFENAEGNLGIANALFEHFSQKLPISRLQRDLTDSTVLRNIGTPFGHFVIALSSISKGLNKLLINEAKIKLDLENNWAVVAEAIQTILRRERYPNPYEKLKDLTRSNDVISETSIKNFIESLDVEEDIKAELRKITPYNYTGIA
jgi:adenylosuccinate lyase